MPEQTTKLASVKQRAKPLTVEQHAEIAALIKSSVDSKAKNPTPYLTYHGRIVVRREVTTMARVVGVRRLTGHAKTFTNALAEFERKQAAGVAVDERTFYLCVEHLWRWLHGYVRPPEPAHWFFNDLKGKTLIMPDRPGGVPILGEISASDSETPSDDEWPDVIGGDEIGGAA